MSISNLVTSTQGLRLLDGPTASKEINLSQATLKKAKNLVDTWERKYTNRFVRHLAPTQVPTIVTFDKLDDEVVIPMLTLGGK